MKNARKAMLVAFVLTTALDVRADVFPDLVNKLEILKADLAKNSLLLFPPTPSIATVSSPVACQSRDEGGCLRVGFTMSAEIVYDADAVKDYSRKSAEAFVSAVKDVGDARDLIKTAEKDAGLSAEQRAGLKKIEDESWLTDILDDKAVAMTHVANLRRLAGVTGKIRMDDGKFQDLSKRTSDRLAADRKRIEDMISAVKQLAGFREPDGRYFTDLKLLDDCDVDSVLLFRDIPGHEREVLELVKDAGLMTRKTQIDARFNPRKAIYVADGARLSPELKKRWFGDDPEIVAVVLGEGRGVERIVVEKHTLGDFQWTYNGKIEPDAIEMEKAFLHSELAVSDKDGCR